VRRRKGYERWRENTISTGPNRNSDPREAEKWKKAREPIEGRKICKNLEVGEREKAGKMK